MVQVVFKELEFAALEWLKGSWMDFYDTAWINSLPLKNPLLLGAESRNEKQTQQEVNFSVRKNIESN